MAIDTALKRASAINVGSPWRAILPLPDGTIDQGDRQTVAFSYSGILAAAVAASVPLSARVLPGRNLTANVRAGRNLTGRVV